MSARLYADLAPYYDLIYQWKPYAKEAERLHALLAREGVPDGAEIVDVACGTASHLDALAQWYRVRGRDVAGGMLEVARRKLPGVHFARADFVNDAVTPPAAAILCLFSAIGYVHPEPALQAAAQRLAEGLAPGGVLVIEPWVDAATFRGGNAMMQTYESADLKLCRAIVTRCEGAFSVLEFHWLIAASGAPRVQHEVEEHRLWLCPLDTLLAALAAAGLTARVEPDGISPDRPLVVARKSLSE